ncbi:MAG: hypothetical protein ACK4RV_17860 [Caulobacter sp.]
MRPPDGRTALYWRCGGEVLALGGPLPLARPGGLHGGCRPVDPAELLRLAAWHRAELAAAPPGPVRDWHRQALRDAKSAIANQSRLT